ncbi:MAG: DUF4349 domain-containing protein [Phaeodactylibacter sp.]|nr:DUF4349 domain-containing protein [Phaeodactylibacter sp.]
MRKSPTLLLPFYLLIAALSGCASSQRAPQEPVPGRAGSGLSYEESAPEQGRQERKALYFAYLTLVVENPDSAGRQIERIAEKYNGYVNEIGSYRAIIRVESGQLDAAIADIEALGKLRRKNILGQDVTEEYQDYQIRLENAEKARGRYLELLNKAETVEEILKVERELERLNETIDLLKGRMARLDHLEAFSTISVELQERKKPGLLGYIGLGVYHAVKWLFVRN